MTQAIERAGARPAGEISAAAAKSGARLPAIDQLRGLVILLMALDHVRDFFNAEAMQFDPLDLTRTYPALFLTRFITHICAPTFVLLAGMSAFLHGKKLGDRRALALFLLTRGAWLILLDIAVISPVWRLEFGPVYLATLWAIGISIIALSALVWLSPISVLLVAALILSAHNLLDSVHASGLGPWAPLWTMLHEPGPLPFGLHGGLIYPVLPWIGIMALGYGLGSVFLEPAGLRRRQLNLLGLASIALFLLLRGTNFYGDPHPWSAQASGTMTALSMLKVTKYPPSLLYALATLGPALLLLSAMERLNGFLGELLATFGRVPLFAYVLHLYAAHAAAIALFLAEGFTIEQLRGLSHGAAPPEGLGLGLAGTYAAWIIIMAALFPICRWFAGVKRRRRDWWLSYL